MIIEDIAVTPARTISKSTKRQILELWGCDLESSLRWKKGNRGFKCAEKIDRRPRSRKWRLRLSSSSVTGALSGQSGEEANASSRFIGDAEDPAVARLPMELEWRSSAIALFGLKASSGTASWSSRSVDQLTSPATLLPFTQSGNLRSALKFSAQISQLFFY